MTASKSSLKTPVTKEEVQARLGLGWSRTIAANGGKRATFAEAIGVHPDTVRNALAGDTLPELHTVLNSLLACPNALDELFALVGMRLVPDNHKLSPDMELLVNATRFSATLAEALQDNRRDHRETLHLGDLARPIIGMLSQIVAEADAIKSGDNVRSIAR